jgi:hypothetical protein
MPGYIVRARKTPWWCITLVAKETIDEDVMQVLAKKQAGQEALLQAVKARVRGIYQEVS